MNNYQQTWARPKNPKPVVIIGAGGIVRDSHLPAYHQAGIPVAGLFDIDQDKAKQLASSFDIPRTFDTLEQALEQHDVIFDIATAPVAYRDILTQLPKGSPVLIQKPFGMNLTDADELLALCNDRQLKAAVNFQLRFAPMMLVIRNAMETGFFGTLTEIEVHLNLVTPWHQFPHLAGNPRVEIVAHSIHYIDLIQSLIGTPTSVFARSFSSPGSTLSDTRTSAILDYGTSTRVVLSINHHHDFGRSHQSSQIRFEGDKGAAVAHLGVLLDYPKGEPDALWMGTPGNTLQEVPLQGSWFPEAFGNVMSNMQRFVTGEDSTLHTNVDSAWQTMAIVEALYRSAKQPGEPVPSQENENS